eukprot:656274-Pyramimonas_sp.AAC.1
MRAKTSIWLPPAPGQAAGSSGVPPPPPPPTHPPPAWSPPCQQRTVNLAEESATEVGALSPTSPAALD